MIAAVLVELRRMASWRRWWFVLVPVIVVDWALADALVTRSSSMGFTVNGWDVPLELLNHPRLVPIVLVTLGGLLCGQVITSDRIDGYAALTVTRLDSITTWWISKIVAVAIVYMLVAVVLGALIRAVVTGRLGWEVSAYGSASPDPFGTLLEAQRRFGPPPLAGQAAPLRLLPVYAYTTAAITALLAVCFVPAAKWPRAWLPMVTVVAVVMIFTTVTPTTVLHPLIHLLWDWHSFASSSTAVSWGTSAAVMAVELSVAVVGGIYLARHSDMMRSS